MKVELLLSGDWGTDIYGPEHRYLWTGAIFFDKNATRLNLRVLVAKMQMLKQPTLKSSGLNIVDSPEINPVNLKLSI